MASSLPASLFLLSVVFWQFVAAADQNNSSIKAEPGQSAFLPCKDSDEGGIQVIEWSRTDLKSGYVLLYRDGRIDPDVQIQSYKDRMDLLVNQIQKRDASLVLQNTAIDDSGTYECRVKQTNREKKLISTVSLVVAPRPPEPFPVWATVLLVLLVLALVAVALYFLFHWKPVQQVKVESGVEFVLLPLKVPHCLWFCKYRIFQHVDKVEWKDGYNRKVHVYQNGPDQPGEQNQIYRTRTKMDENLLKTGDLSLTLSWPTGEDNDTYTCRVYNKNEKVLMKKDIRLKVKDQQVMVESGEESVLLSCSTTEDLDGVFRVEWKDGDGRTVHVYQNGSDQHEEQDEFYRNRTKMDKNPRKTKDLSLIVRRPRERDNKTYSCTVSNKDGDILMRNYIWLQVKVPQVMVEPGEEFVLLPCSTTEDLDGDVRVEWTDEYNRKVHVYQNGPDQPGEQNKFYRTRTKMYKNPLKDKDLSLILIRPTRRDAGIYTCTVYNRDEVILVMKDVLLWVKVHQVEVKPGVKSVLLPWRTRKNLDGVFKVEWTDEYNRKVHVHQNGSDQPGEQNQIYRNRTKMDENFSLTLMGPTDGDVGTFTCSVYNRDGNILMMKDVRLWVKGSVQNQPEDTRTRRNSIDPSPLMADQSV